MHIAQLWAYPIKSLAGVAVNSALIAPGGGLRLDRGWALLDAEGNFINGKREPRLHRVRACYSEDITAVTLSYDADSQQPQATIALDDLPRLSAWFTETLRQPVTVRRDERTGFPDDLDAPGPTLIAAASLAAIAAWFPGLTADDVRARLRPNAVIAGANAWDDDGWFGPPGTQQQLRLGSVILLGNNPCQRCAVPTRDPHTGDVLTGFQAQFARQRQAELPPFAPAARFTHFYRAAVNTCVPPTEAGKRLAVGDVFEVLD
jgi:uncharacterized protein YcbX